MNVFALGLGLILATSACSNADFGGGNGSAQPASTKTKKDTSTDTDTATATHTETKTTTSKKTATATEVATEEKTATETSTSTESKPPVGPGSDLTLTINDTDSKLDSFQVQNAVSQAWLPLTWHQGVQQIPGACSPESKTILHLKMHAKSGLFTNGGDLATGSCNAPLTQTTPTIVDVGVAPTCGNIKGRFSLSCSGSASLSVVP